MPLMVPILLIAEEIASVDLPFIVEPVGPWHPAQFAAYKDWPSEVCGSWVVVDSRTGGGGASVLLS